jgi:hypothetical protein
MRPMKCDAREYRLRCSLRRRLRRLGHHWRPVVRSSGLKEWSDAEIARLQPRWVRTFLRRHRGRCAVLAILYVIGLGLLAASLERYWRWSWTLEAVASEPVKVVDQWQAVCAAKPWMAACRPSGRSPARSRVPRTAFAAEGRLVKQSVRAGDPVPAPF